METGGVARADGASIVFRECSFERNFVDNSYGDDISLGGVAYLSGSSIITVINSSFAENTAWEDGNTLFLTGASTAEVYNSTFLPEATSNSAIRCEVSHIHCHTLEIDASLQ